MILTSISESIQNFHAHGCQQSATQILEDQTLMRRLMSIIDCSSTITTSDEMSSDGGHAVNERLKTIADTLATLDTTDSNVDGYTTALARTGACHQYVLECRFSEHQTNRYSIDALLHLLVMHLHLTSSQKAISGEQISSIRTLCALFTQPQLEPLHTTCEYMFDVAIYLTDDISDDLRTHISYAEPQGHNDPRISFLFGPNTATDGWLGLVTSNNAVQPPGSISRPNTPPARFGPGQQQAGRMQQRTPAPQRQTSSVQHAQKNFNLPVPYPLRRWELLPDQGNNASSNDTAISLSLFGARKVDSQL